MARGWDFRPAGKNRPNRIESTICHTVRREGRSLWVAELDAIDGTPLLDILPVMPEFLSVEEARPQAY
jgi:tRNA (Thr-GGU) A37 N-methylase